MQPNNNHNQLPQPAQPNDTKPKLSHSIKSKVKKTPKWLLILLGVVGALVVAVLAVLLWFLTVIYSVRTDVGVNGQIFEVKQGSSISEIASGLASQNLIANATAFEIYARFGSARGKLLPGPYLVRPSSSIATIINDMNTGHIAENKITFPEGITIKDMASRYEAAGYGTKEDYLTTVTQLAPNYSFIPTSSLSNPEGYLFPSTYGFVPNKGASELVSKQFAAFESEMLPLLQGPKPAGFSNEQVLTLASIVEKEALTEKDRKLVTGVFLNRIRLGMKLESDVTVNYATGKKTTTPADIGVVSPYNTYKVLGLTPTPINNPSTDVVEAVLNYTPNDFIFFLAGTDGVVYYAKTLSQHNENIKNHL